MLTIADRIAAINEQPLTVANDEVVSLLLRFSDAASLHFGGRVGARPGDGFFHYTRGRYRPGKPSDGPARANCAMK